MLSVEDRWCTWGSVCWACRRKRARALCHQAARCLGWQRVAGLGGKLDPSLCRQIWNLNWSPQPAAKRGASRNPWTLRAKRAGGRLGRLLWRLSGTTALRPIGVSDWRQAGLPSWQPRRRQAWLQTRRSEDADQRFADSTIHSLPFLRGIPMVILLRGEPEPVRRMAARHRRGPMTRALGEERVEPAHSPRPCSRGEADFFIGCATRSRNQVAQPVCSIRRSTQREPPVCASDSRDRFHHTDDSFRVGHPIAKSVFSSRSTNPSRRPTGTSSAAPLRNGRNLGERVGEPA